MGIKRCCCAWGFLENDEGEIGLSKLTDKANIFNNRKLTDKVIKMAANNLILAVPCNRPPLRSHSSEALWISGPKS